jgi:hypothetical protein
MSHERPRVIFFFMKGCPHCDRSWPAWDKAKGQLRSMADVSETESAEVSPRDGVSSFPTFVVRRGNQEVTRVEGAQEDSRALMQALGLRRRRARGRRPTRRGRRVTKRTLRNYKAL